MSAPLDSRVVRIVRWLMTQTEARSTADLANDLVLSERAIRYRLSAVQNFLQSHGAALLRQRGTGLSIEADDEARLAITADLDARTAAPRVYAQDEREHLLLEALLWSHPHTVSLDQLNEELEVSKTSARRDLKRCEPWLARMGLPVVRKPSEGIGLVGSEQCVRRALVQLFLEAVPSDVLTIRSLVDPDLLQVRVPAGLGERLSLLPIDQCADALRRSQFRDSLAMTNSGLVCTLYTAISVARVEAGRPIELDPDHVQTLLDKPMSDTVRSLELAAVLGEDQAALSDEEIAGVTEYLLGFDALANETSVSTVVEQLVSDILVTATGRLNVKLVDDDELRRSLETHLTRLDVRLRHALPVHNSLRNDVAQRYPEVQAVSEELCEKLSSHFAMPLGADEIGFLTMYLAGAIERGYLRPRKRAMVVSPACSATNWVLVSRLQAEFPDLALVEVLCASNYEDHDVVISTTPLDEVSAPVVVVDPLLPRNDVRALSRLV